MYIGISVIHFDQFKDMELSGLDSLGEDAFYVNKNNSRFDSYGVADGVGGWRSRGVDPR